MELWVIIVYWLKKFQLEFYWNLRIFLAVGFQRFLKKAPFMYVEICPWVILFNPKLENEVLNDIQTCRSEKHGFFKFRGRSPRYWQLWGLHFGLQSLKNATIINFRKKWKFLLFIIFAQNAPVLTCNPNEWNGIRFLTMKSP